MFPPHEQDDRPTEPSQLAPADRYQRDAVFHQLVDFLEHHIHLGNYTPTELREACILAATIHESRTIRQLYLRRDDEIERLR